jgi:hypothetical protein
VELLAFSDSTGNSGPEGFEQLLDQLTEEGVWTKRPSGTLSPTPAW